MTDKLVATHDILFKKSLENPVIAKDFFHAHLPPEIRQRILLETLKIEKGSFIDENYKQHHTDMLFSVKLENNLSTGFIYLLAEHQSTPDESMPLRLLQYIVRILNQYQDKKTGKLPVVVPLVYYHGIQSPYPYSTDILQLFADSALAKTVMFKPFQLVDMTVMDDKTIIGHKHAAVMEMLHKHVFNRDILPAIQYLADYGLLALIPEAGNSDYTEVVLKYIYYRADSGAETQLTALLTDALPQEEKQIMTIAQRIEQRVKYDTSKEIAYKMLQDGFSIDTISKLTELPKESIKELEQA